MRRVLWSAVVLAFAAVAAWAADEKPKTEQKPKTVAEIKKAAENAERELFKQFESLTESKEDQKKGDDLYSAFQKQQARWFEEALEIAKADPKADTAFDAVEWVLTNPQVYYQPIGKSALQLATEHFATSPKLGKVVLTLGRFGPQEGTPAHQPAQAFMKAVADTNKDKGVIGIMAFVAATKAKEKFARAEYRKAKDADELATVAERAFESAAKDHGDVKLIGRGETQTIADVAKVELFELRNLRVGKTAPDIEGEDLDGVKFKLSDYKGKVVVLDFWGDW